LLFEVFVALAIAVGIVWWTFSGRRRESPDDEPGEGPR
jgi:hypothetical protein